MRTTGLILVALVLGVVPAAATAAADLGWFAGHSTEERHALVDYAYLRAAQPDVPYTGAATDTAQTLADDVAATHEFPLASELGAEELGTLQGVGLVEPLGALAPALFAGVATLGVGWRSGPACASCS